MTYFTLDRTDFPLCCSFISSTTLLYSFSYNYHSKSFIIFIFLKINCTQIPIPYENISFLKINKQFLAFSSIFISFFSFLYSFPLFLFSLSLLFQQQLSRRRWWQRLAGHASGRDPGGARPRTAGVRRAADLRRSSLLAVALSGAAPICSASSPHLGELVRRRLFGDDKPVTDTSDRANQLPMPRRRHSGSSFFLWE